jgi:flavodoxin
MNVLVAYESFRGHTRQTAEAIAAAARGRGYEVVLKPMSEVQTADVETANALFLGTWVQGFILFGVRPAGAKRWVSALPSLKGKQVGMFCTYAFSPRGSLNTLRTLLEGRGAIIRGLRAFQRSEPTDAVEPFVKTVLDSVTV